MANGAESGGLDHPTRERIHRHLLLLPGDHFRSIVRALGLAHGTASHHLDVLKRLGLVQSEKRSGRCRYYTTGSESELKRNQLFMQHWNYRDLRYRVLLVVRRLTDAKPATVARFLGISRQLAAYHLAHLEEIGLVRRENGGYRRKP